MKLENKFFLCLVVSLILIFTSGVAFADEAPAMELVENETVSGDVDVISSNPWEKYGSLEYTILDDVDEIKSVNVVVTTYSGSGAPTYALYSNITLDTKDGVQILGYEDLYCDINMANDPTVYRINDHTTKQYSDYQSVFNITDSVKSLSSGDTIKISVNNTKKEGYNFDGRIKLIALTFAYDDGDNDEITYWLNFGQSWTQSTRTNIINTKDFDGEYDEVLFENIALSSYNAQCKINDELIYDPIYEKEGSYFIDAIWDITDKFVLGQDTNFTYKASSSGYGSYKSNIQLLKTIKSNIALETTITPQYKGTIYVGVPNVLTVDIISDKNINATVKLYDGENLVYTNTTDLTAGITNQLLCVDSTIRPITADTVYGADNKYVNYTLVIEDSKGNVLDSTNVSYVILYNGNLGKEFEYPNANPLLRKYDITGDVVIVGGTVYAGSSDNLADVLTVDYDGVVSDALLYVAYNWNNPSLGDFTSWNITFNDQAITPIANYMDQGNLGTYGLYSYGLVVYNVTDLVVKGDNNVSIIRTPKNVAIYPVSLLILTNDDESSVAKTVYILEETDLLSKTNNKNLLTGFETGFDVIDGNATLYVFAAGAQAGEGNLIINGENITNVWNGTSKSVEIYGSEVDSGNITVYFESIGGTILALHQMVVVENIMPKSDLNISASAENIIVGEDAIVVVEGLEDATGYVHAIDGDTIYFGKIINGTANVTVPGLEVGNYNISVIYSGNGMYNSCNTTVKFSVVENGSDIVIAPDVVKYFHGSERFVVSVSDYKGNPSANKTVNITINGASYTRTTDENGTASIALGLGAGTYNVTSTVDNITVNSTVTILTTVNGTDVVKIFRNGTQYYATFRDSEGNYLADGTTVRFNINGVFYDRQVSGDKGLARLNLNLVQGEYILTAINLETGEQSGNLITIIPKIVENKNITKYFRNATQYTVKVLDDEGNPVGEGKEVTFNINGVLYKRSTDENGIAKMNINLNPGVYVITAEYDGCVVSNTVTILPTLTASDLTKAFLAVDPFVATLVDGQGKAVINEKVSFNINGVLYTRTTDLLGKARLNINLVPGKYIITSSYGDAVISNTVTVTW